MLLPARSSCSSNLGVRPNRRTGRESQSGRRFGCLNPASLRMASGAKRIRGLSWLGGTVLSTDDGPQTSQMSGFPEPGPGRSAPQQSVCPSRRPATPAGTSTTRQLRGVPRLDEAHQPLTLDPAVVRAWRIPARRRGSHIGGLPQFNVGLSFLGCATGEMRRWIAYPLLRSQVAPIGCRGHLGQEGAFSPTIDR